MLKTLERLLGGRKPQNIVSSLRRPNHVLVVPHNHFDPIWRRCFDRPAVYNGVTVRSYAEVEAHCINAWLELADQGYPFSEGQAAVWRKYLECYPDQRDRLRRLADQGRLTVMLAGETVQDSNMPAPEGLIRNFLVAMPLYRDLVGEDHPGLKLAWLEDGFGSSANYPQVLRGMGAEVVCATQYRQCPPVWVGIDGTAILCYDHVPSILASDNVMKHPPCPDCQGQGCDVCQGTGLQFIDSWNVDQLRQALHDALSRSDDTVVVHTGSEEYRPSQAVIDVVNEVNRETENRIRLGTPLDIYQTFRPALERQLNHAERSPSPEINPVMPGCMVSRIANKQRTRAIAYKLIRAEAEFANRAWQANQPTKLPPEFSTAWQKLTFNQFHDAITGTHIDSANAELLDMLDQAETVADRYLPQRPLPPDPAFTPSDSTRKRIGQFDVAFDRTGIISILKDGVDVFGTVLYKPHRRPFRIGELVLESDFGDAWGQRIAPFPSPENNITRVQLGDFHDRVETATKTIRWQGTYRGGDPHVRQLAWTVVLSASDDGSRLEFNAEVHWDTSNRRLRVIVPVASQERSALYEIPFGFIERTYDPQQFNTSQWSSNTLEFPTLHWACKTVTPTSGVAVLNRGLPCYRWMPGYFEVSLLRSPEWTFCANEPAYYEFWDVAGQRDTGSHRFEYAILPFYTGLDLGDLTRLGYAYNHAAPDLPFEVRGNVVVTAWKPAEDGSGWIMRLQEAGGQGTDVTLTFGKSYRVTPTDLLERISGEPVQTQAYGFRLHRHGIKTLLIQIAPT